MDRDVRWFSMPVSVQISNIGSEVARAIRWMKKEDYPKMKIFYRKAVDLLRLSQKDPKNANRVGELQVAIEELADYFVGENVYGTTDSVLTRYYDAFL